ncbi:trafficking kinesin-binding protein 1-like isoform X1 [Notolabrus celidotus]|uniref:trafficking kinesin-binding protein 1-like isoform X1 n=1 Tax=Notolabrus celidotus TaxID=1203425 RepID=UPI00148FFC37|nr:trafficking kinesin-binding protein 1-like isoform X1 [Notolabrus celidotus]XP_034560238.1 trafficking kinesin-binding protein 1-like isoform X1 [Notolabrus celidotus]XP_034560240.1 trafficking kinesin-binding protein 1-like isoform X1 [Notolabrus celidotus]
MTKTYNDIDAVTRLLEEKERDLELAARIGQSLLKKNRNLTEQNDYLEERVGQITEEVAQLHHELNLKDELLQFYTNAAEESEDETGSSPTGKKSKLESAAGGFLSDTLQRKLKDLEEENLSLRSEAHHLKSETETYEEKEQQLVNDCVKELRLSSLQISTIAEELARKTEDASRQQEEITHLLSQIVDLQKKAKSFAVENEELSQHLVAAKDAQKQLTVELQELEEKYSECIEMLHEAQEELKNLRNRNYPAGTPRRFHPLGLYPMDSLAAEIEGTMRKEMSLDDPECEEQKTHRKRVFETVKTVNQTVRQRSLTPTGSNIPGSNQSLSTRTSPQSSGLSTPHSTIYGCDVSGDSVALDNRTQSILMEEASNQDNSTESREKKASGAEDLRLALRRLSLRRQNNLSERRFFEEERDRRRGGHGGLHDALGQESVMTPSESIMSLGNLHVWASRGPYLPDKLQIVKPLEGSATLHHWQQLAQPHLGVILDARPGVVPKGYRPLELELEQVYPWGGLEEDEPGEQYFQNLPTSSATASPAVPPTSSISDPYLGQPPPILPLPSPPSPSPSPHLSNTDVLAAYYPGKCMAHTSSTYTFTTCRILHPTDEQTRVTPSLNPVPSSSSCVMTSTLLGTPVATPCTPRRLGLRPSESSTNLRDATRTTSTSLGLVRLLQERGISAAMYHQSSSLEQGQGNGGVLFSTSIAPNRAPNPDPLRPSTPPNSPTGEGTSAAPTPAGFDFKSPSYDNFLASKPARSILKEVAGRMRGRQRGRDCESQTDVSVTVHNLNLLDKVKRLGVAGASGGRAVSPSPILGPLGGLRRSGSPFGPDGMRRNRSYPAMVGASMAMKAPGPQE